MSCENATKPRGQLFRLVNTEGIDAPLVRRCWIEAAVPMVVAPNECISLFFDDGYVFHATCQSKDECNCLEDIALGGEIILNHAGLLMVQRAIRYSAYGSIDAALVDFYEMRYPSRAFI